MIHVIKEMEAGYLTALHGLAFNKKMAYESMPGLARKLAFKDGGHNKFLESICVWFNVRAPRYWWQEADTFRLSTKQSESTMHTLIDELTNFNVAGNTIEQNRQFQFMKENFEEAFGIEHFHDMILQAHADNITRLKALLPEGFLQRRLWCMNYKCLRNIILQRRTHRLPHWRQFIDQVLEQVDHPELLPTRDCSNMQENG